MKKIIEKLKSLLWHKESHLPFELLFEGFREVLNSNNRSLEIITDMGEKLSGEYLFDINYTSAAYSELTSAVRDSLHRLDMLTKNRFPELHDVFNRIDEQVKRVIYGIHPSSGELVLFYEDITWDKYSMVGGKNSNMAELRNYLKINIPGGFAITIIAFDELIRHNNLRERIEALNTNAAESQMKELQELIINSEIPDDLDIAIDKAIEKIKTKNGENCFFAVRSSAEEEDSEFSFAGQFESVLNVPLNREAILEAYKRVVASLFSERAVSYQRQLGYEIGKSKMAVGCMSMVDALTSGVIYSANPEGDSNTLMISAAWGLGISVVEGQVDSDLFIVKKDVNPEIIDIRRGRKESMIVSLREAGTEKIATPDNMVEKQCLTEELVSELTREAVAIERHFRKPQDIEWAIDRDGRIFILQARPLKVLERQVQGARVKNQKTSEGRLQTVLMKDKGIVVQRGVVAGRVFILKHMDELNNFPKGAVLVARNDSSNFIKVIPYASAIITDTGTPTSHMAALCREFRILTVVNTANATHVLKHGQEITVAADEGNITIYDGISEELLKQADTGTVRMEELYEFRKKRYILRYISPLNLIDPLSDKFTPEGCKTIHDILRFIHEKAITELIESARYGIKGHVTVRLDLPIPAGIVVIDIDGGLDIAKDKKVATIDSVSSIPLKALVKGMTHPGVWHSDMVPLRMHDLITGMMRAPDVTADNYAENHLAIASREYLNLSLRFGYHFNMLDCYCSENARNNHIYFRFVGGAADIVKRSRRIELISLILKEYGFNIKTKGDLIIARLAGLRQEEIEKILDYLGRLIAYTRQMDAMLHNDSAVKQYVRNFMEGKY